MNFLEIIIVKKIPLMILIMYFMLKGKKQDLQLNHMKISAKH